MPRSAPPHVSAAPRGTMMHVTTEQADDRYAARTSQRQRDRTVQIERVSTGAVRKSGVESRAVGLGWFSVALGVGQLLAPRQVARLIGLDEDDGTTRSALMAIGLREVATGIGLLSQSRPAAWAWARTAGDLMDLALLGYAWQRNPASREQMLSVGGAVLGCALVDAQTARELQQSEQTASSNGAARQLHVRQSVTILKPPDEVYAFFRNFENLPRFMEHLESVTNLGERSHWRARGPLGSHVEWDAELVEDTPGCIAWRSLPGADVPNRGRVTFEAVPGGRGTELAVTLDYQPPAGAIGAQVAQWFGREPAQQVSADLRRLKQVMETGEVLHSDASLHRGMHPARPSQLSSAREKQVKS
jgi:uncharacterized membrane protein